MVSRTLLHWCWQKSFDLPFSSFLARDVFPHGQSGFSSSRYCVYILNKHRGEGWRTKDQNEMPGTLPLLERYLRSPTRTHPLTYPRITQGKLSTNWAHRYPWLIDIHIQGQEENGYGVGLLRDSATELRLRWSTRNWPESWGTWREGRAGFGARPLSLQSTALCEFRSTGFAGFASLEMELLDKEDEDCGTANTLVEKQIWIICYWPE